MSTRPLGMPLGHCHRASAQDGLVKEDQLKAPGRSMLTYPVSRRNDGGHIRTALLPQSFVHYTARRPPPSPPFSLSG